MQDSLLNVTICRCSSWCRQTMRVERFRRLCILRSNHRMKKSIFCWLMRLSQRKCSSLTMKHTIHSCSQRNTKRTIPSRTIGCGMGYLYGLYFFVSIKNISSQLLVRSGIDNFTFSTIFQHLKIKTIFYIFSFSSALSSESSLSSTVFDCWVFSSSSATLSGKNNLRNSINLS